MDHWDAVEALRLIETHGITHTHMVPTMFHRLLALPEETRRALRHVVAALRHPRRRAVPGAGQAAPHRVARPGRGRVLRRHRGSRARWSTPKTWLAHPGTVGPAHGARDWSRWPTRTATSCPPGEIGLVFLQAPAATKFDYYGDAEKTADAFRGDYFTLGDMGYMDEDGLPLPDRPHGQPHHLGRREHLPGRGRRRPARAPGRGRRGHHRRARRGVGRGGQGGRAAGRGRRRAATSWPTELMEFCRDHLAHFKCPRSVDFVVGAAAGGYWEDLQEEAARAVPDGSTAGN